MKIRHLIPISLALALAHPAPAQDDELSLRERLQSTMTQYGARSRETAKASLQLAKFYIDDGRPTDAERYLRRALVIVAGPANTASIGGDFYGSDTYVNNLLRNPSNIPGSLDAARVLFGYGAYFHCQSRTEDAKRVLQRAMQMPMPSSTSQGYASPVAVASANDQFHEDWMKASKLLADLHVTTGDTASADATHKQRLQYTKTVLGETHKHHSRALKDYAEHLHKHDRHEEAEAHEARAKSLAK